MRWLTGRAFLAPDIQQAIVEGRQAIGLSLERLMRAHGIRALASRRFRPITTDSRYHLPIAPNPLVPQADGA